MATVTKPLILDETGQQILEAINGIKSSVDNGSLAVRGKDGTPAGFGVPTITVVNDDPEAEPSATITASGPDTAKVFAIELKNIKGKPGDGKEGDKVASGDGIKITKDSDTSTISLSDDVQTKLNKIDNLATVAESGKYSDLIDIVNEIVVQDNEPNETTKSNPTVWVKVRNTEDVDPVQTESISSKVQELEAKVDTIDGRSSSNATQIKGATNLISTLRSDVTDLQGDVKNLQNLQGDVSGMQSTLGTLQGNVNTLQGSVGTLQTDVGEAKTNITSLQNSVSDLESEIDALDYSKIVVQDSEPSPADGNPVVWIKQVNAEETTPETKSSLESKIEALNTTINELQSKLNTQQSLITKQQGLIDALEAKPDPVTMSDEEPTNGSLVWIKVAKPA